MVIVFAVVGAAMGALMPAPANAGPVNCADFPEIPTLWPGSEHHLVTGVVSGNLEIAPQQGATGFVCTVAGTVTGNVKVRDDSSQCDTRPPFTAVNVVGGTVDGNVQTSGGACVMLWLRDGAAVGGNLVHRSGGNLGFLGATTGATVDGNVILAGDDETTGLFAGAAETNRVRGHIICIGGEPAGDPALADETDWDGDGTVDGTIGGHFLC